MAVINLKVDVRDKIISGLFRYTIGCYAQIMINEWQSPLSIFLMSHLVILNLLHFYPSWSKHVRAVAW